VRVKRGAANVRSVEDLLYRNRLERLLLDQRDERIAESVARAPDSEIDFLS
jgi:hypothetical protein